MKRSSLVLLALVLVAGLASVAMSATYRNVDGITTGDTAVDTTITASSFTPRGAEAVGIWNPDGECWITITNSGSSGSQVATYLMPADSDLQIIPVSRVTTVAINKLGVQRVGVYFMGN